MDRASLLESFTENEEIDEWSEYDETTTLRGYVDSIEGVRQVSGQSKYLCRVTINNGKGRRVRFLLWDTNAKNYSHMIRDRMILTITRGRTTRLKTEYLKAGEKFAVMEVSYIHNTKLEMDDDLFEENTEPAGEVEIPVIELSDVADSIGSIYVQGYLKLTFELVSTGSTSYGSGLLADLAEHKIRIRVANYKNINFPIGTCVKVRGEVRFDKSNSAFLQVQSSTDIVEVDGKPTLLPENLRKAIKTPKRRLQ